MSVKYFGSDALNKLIDLVKTALGLKADDSNVVHKTGDETVAGEKSFSDRATIQKTGSDVPLLLKGNSDASWIAFTTASGSIYNPIGYMGVKSDNKPYFYSGGAKRLALLEETMPFVQNATTSLNNLTQGFVSRYCTATDSPSGSAGWFGIMTIHCGYLRQLAFPISSNKIYARYNDGSSWSSWTTLHS